MCSRVFVGRENIRIRKRPCKRESWTTLHNFAIVEIFPPQNMDKQAWFEFNNLPGPIESHTCRVPNSKHMVNLERPRRSLEKSTVFQQTPPCVDSERLVGLEVRPTGRGGTCGPEDLLLVSV